MSNASILSAIKSLAGSFSACPIFWTNEIFRAPDPPGPFVWADFTGTRSDLLGSGSKNISDDHGFVRFHVFVPFGSGLEGAYAIADQLTALYRAAYPPSGIAGLQTEAATIPETGAQSDDGNYSGVSFSVMFTYWHS